MTTSFYAPPEAFQGRQVTLPEEEARHAARALRKQSGDEIVVVDGAGGWHRVRLEQADKRRVAGTVLETKREVGEPAYRLTVGLSLLKNKNRFETFLEKAAELGVHRVVPLRTTRTEKTGFRRPRFERILVAAMKQCGRSRRVELADPQPLPQALEDHAGDLTLLCHEDTAEQQGLVEVVQQHADGAPLSLWVGPEGGFAEEEVEHAQATGVRMVSLGPRRLRAETAALAAATGVMLARR